MLGWVKRCFLVLQEMQSEKRWVVFLQNILHSVEYYHFLHDNGALWIWGAVECWVIGLNILALLCYLLERKRREGTNSVKVLSSVKVLTEWKKKSSFRAPVKCLVFPSKYRIYGCMEGFCGHYLTWITLGLNASFSALSIWCKASSWPWRAI